MKNLSHFPKTDIRCWESGVFRQQYIVDGQRRLTKEWYARVQFQGKRAFFQLGTPNRAAAAAKARDIFLFLTVNGWPLTLARYKARSQSAPAADTSEIRVGPFLDAVFSVCTNRSTIEGYAIAFRKVVADLFGLATDPAKFDYQSGGRDEWLAKIHGIRLSEITPAKIQEWKQSFLAAAGDDPLALRRARISVDTLLRRSRSLFSAKVLRQLPLSLPSPLPFDGVEFEPRQSMKYRSNFNVLDLIKLANKELRPSDPPVYMIFLLGVAAGLRRKEIDLLEWSAFRFKENAIRVEPTQFFHPKSQDSIAEIQVDTEVMSIFREYHNKAKGTFVIPSDRIPKTVTRGDYYRCESHFASLNTWLRSKGVNTQKPLHTLRKEYGSLINKAHGIHAASKTLRHADISFTNNCYPNSRTQVTPGLGRLFAPKKSGKLPRSSK